MKSILFGLFFMWSVPDLCVRAQSYRMPHENEQHEGTWLQWPHHHEYGVAYRNGLDATWIEMTRALVDGEKVFIIAYNLAERSRIISLLEDSNVPLSNVEFFVFPTNDVWVRDSGPVFVRDLNGNLHIEDWGFNGWGGKFNYDLCDPIPSDIGESIDIPVIDLSEIMVNEGGAVELDGGGVLMACRSSVISQSPLNSVRNPDMSQTQAESIYAQYLGVSKFIWLDGMVGDPYDVTDFHIDGFAKFLNSDTLVTMNFDDLTYWGASSSDISVLYEASNRNGTVYTKVFLPLTQNNVINTSGSNLESKASYVNYYVGNEVVLVPNYNDPNDDIANGIIQALYSDKTVVGIDCRNLYEWGGMVHCVTQQQPVSVPLGMGESDRSEDAVKPNYPNPFRGTTMMDITVSGVADARILICNSVGQQVSEQVFPQLLSGEHSLVICADGFPDGLYSYRVWIGDKEYAFGRMMVGGD